MIILSKGKEYSFFNVVFNDFFSTECDQKKTRLQKFCEHNSVNTLLIESLWVISPLISPLSHSGEAPSLMKKKMSE